jgi:hypothetical protein
MGPMDCDSAWSDAVSAWNNSSYYQGALVDFSDAVFGQFRACAGSDWGNLYSFVCKSHVRCNEREGLEPAGSLVLDSLIAVHSIFLNTFAAVTDLANGDASKFGVEFGILSNITGRSSQEEIERMRRLCWK